MDIRMLNKTATSNLDKTAQILYDNGTTNLSGGYPHPLSCGIFMPTTFVVPTRIKPHTSMTGRESQIQHHSCGNKLRRPDTVVEARRPMPTKHCATSYSRHIASQNPLSLDATAQKVYDIPAPAKSGVGIGVPYMFNGHTTAPCAVFSYDTSPCLMVGLVGVSLTRREPLTRYANPASPATLKLAFFGGRLSQSINGKSAMNTHSVSTALVQVFNFQSNHAVRVAFDDNGEPLFCLTDVAGILGLGNANPSRFNLDEAGVHKMYISYPSGAKQVTFINEPNLYRVIFRSNKPEAVKFQNWVFDEVLPTLRKTGSYTIAKPTVPAPKPQSPKLSQSDYATVRRAVYFLSKNMYHTGTATNVIYARLRSLCEVEHMADICYDQLTIVQNELYRIERILRAYTNYRQQTEKTLMSRICMGDSEVVGQAMIAMETTATAYAQVFDEATSAVAYANKVAGEGK